MPGVDAQAGGPRGAGVIIGRPGSWLLVGDETAIPAIRRFAALIPEGVPARIVIEVASEADRVEIEAPVEIEWLYRGSDAPASHLIAFVDGLDAADTVGDDGTFSGYGSVFGNLDSYREVVAPGAFAQERRFGFAFQPAPLRQMAQHAPRDRVRQPGQLRGCGCAGAVQPGFAVGARLVYAVQP